MQFSVILLILLKLNIALAYSSAVPDWMFSPYGKSYNSQIIETEKEKARKKSYDDYNLKYYFTKKHPSEIVNSNHRYQTRLRVLTVDTRDQKNCNKIKITLVKNNGFDQNHLKTMCNKNMQKPLNSIIIFDTRKSEIFSSPEMRKIFGETGNIMIFSGVVLAALYAMPSSVTNWEDGPSHALDNYVDNVRSGPVTDKDEAWLNYVAHPYAGAAYYMLARHSGLSPTKSFLYSAFVSTFIWEYGLEAFAEVPSKQDLWITPVLGSLLGEVFYNLEQQIDDNNGKVLNSKTLGNITKVFLNPAGYLSSSINKLSKYNPIVDSKLELTQQNFSSPNGIFIDSSLMLKLYLYTSH